MISIQYPVVAEGSLRQLATEIRKDLSGGGLVTDDNRYSLRQIEVLIKRVYDEVIVDLDKKDFKEGKMPDPRRLVTYDCLELQPTSEVSCGCQSMGWDVLEVKMPRLYAWRGNSYISYFGFADMVTPFTRVNSIQGLNSHSMISSRPAFYLQGDKAFVVRPARWAALCNVTLVAIPECPTCTTTGRCFDVWATDWAVPPFIKEKIKNVILSRWGQTVTQTAPLKDDRNDGADIKYRN